MLQHPALLHAHSRRSSFHLPAKPSSFNCLIHSIGELSTYSKDCINQRHAFEKTAQSLFDVDYAITSPFSSLIIATYKTVSPEHPRHEPSNVKVGTGRINQTTTATEEAAHAVSSEIRWTRFSGYGGGGKRDEGWQRGWILVESDVLDVARDRCWGRGEVEDAVVDMEWMLDYIQSEGLK